MSKYHDDRTAASDSISIGLSLVKLKRLQPELFGYRGWFSTIQLGTGVMRPSQFREMLAEHLGFGDSRAAVAARTNPELLIAAYTDEQDAVLILQFPQYLVGEYNLQPGSRLLTINTYTPGSAMARDITPGPASTGRYVNFFPIIAEFVSEDMDRIERRKGAIAKAEWLRAAQFAKAKLSSSTLTPRDGRPSRCIIPA